MARSRTPLRLALLLMLAGAVMAFLALGGRDLLTLEALKAARATLVTEVSANPWRSALVYVALYVVVVALSLPGAAVMTLAGGALFGLWRGVALVSVSATVGATLAMLAARFVGRDWVRRRFPQAVETVDRGVARDGAIYLLSLRLAPVFPFFLVNLAMGLTAMPVLRYAALTWAGALPGTVAYTAAGTALASLDRLRDILSPGLLGAFLLLAALPLVGKAAATWLQRRKALRGFRRPRRFDADVIVVGGGSAGLVASYVAAQLRARVILVEAKAMGGDCLNTGCVPSKALIRAARAAAEVRGAERFGVDAALHGVRFRQVMAHVRGAIAAIQPKDSVERYRGLGVDVRQSRATVVDPWSVQLDTGERLTARKLVLATGAHPVVPPVPGLAESGYVTSDTLWDRLETFQHPPGRVVILGGGAIGCELAQAMARLGSAVTLVEQADRLLVREEAEAGDRVAEALRRDGVRLVLGTAAERVEGGALHAGGQALPHDLLIVAVGRRASFDGLGLEQLGLTRESMAADRRGRGPFPHWFVAGDASGGPMFTHFAGHSGAIASLNALLGWFGRLKTDAMVPRVVYTSPEVASVGMVGADAPPDAEIVCADVGENDRDIADGGPGGIVKLVIRKGRLLGITIVAEHAGELIVPWQLALKRKITLGTMLALLYPYPTRADAGREAASQWRQAHKPEWLLRLAERWFARARG